MTNILEAKVIQEYKSIVLKYAKINIPLLTEKEIEEAVDYSINKNFKNSKISIDNNYTNRVKNTTLLDLTEYIINKHPIMTANGVLFAKHGDIVNPIAQMVAGFIQDRKLMKKEMFKYPKGSEEYEKYNLLQLLLKIDANGLYGVLGQHTSLYFNLYVAGSITIQGRSAISAAALLFESFFNNNVPFGSLDEIIVFIDNIKNEKRKFKDNKVLDSNVTPAEVLYKLFNTTGFGYIPDLEDVNIIWEILLNATSQEDLNRIFYKNNLFSFLENKICKDSIIDLLETLNLPYVNPEKVPVEIKDNLHSFYELLSEYVYYDKQIIDRLDKMDSLTRSVVGIIDTDSNILSLDAWYRYALDLVKDEPLNIKRIYIDAVEIIEPDEFGDYPLINPISKIADLDEYDFMSDEIIEMERGINPCIIIPQDGLRFSIINIMSYCASLIVNDYMKKYVSAFYGDNPDVECLMIMKNEFYFGRIMLTEAKKNYATDQILQEGELIPTNKRLDTKGLPAFTKSTMNETTRSKLKHILYEDILSNDNVDQIKILKDLAKVEKQMFLSIQEGETKYYKPVRIKSASNYENPMRIQGISASMVYNAIKDEDMDMIDLDIRNSIIVIKCNIDRHNISKIEETYPDTYNRIKELMKQKQFIDGINAMALPTTEDVPKWILPFVDYVNIISDNISLFPLESLGIYRGNDSNTISNIIKI